MEELFDVVELLKRIAAALERAYPPPPPVTTLADDVLPGISPARWARMGQAERTDALRKHGYPIT